MSGASERLKVRTKWSEWPMGAFTRPPLIPCLDPHEVGGVPRFDC